MSGLKVGKITYTNVLPLYTGFIPPKGGKIELIEAIPAVLNQRMKSAELDLSPISSAAFALAAESYYLLPNLSISSCGPVRSIYFFSKKPIEELDGAKILVTNHSETSIMLLQVLCYHFYNIKPVFEAANPDLEEMYQHADAALLIGDPAIKAKWSGSSFTYVYDLSELWYIHSGLPMTFAVWALQKSSQGKDGLISQVYQAFMTAKQCLPEHINLVSSQLSESFGGTKSFWLEYFNGLSYDLTEEQLKGLNTFFTLANRYGLLYKIPEISIWNPNVVVPE